MLINEMNDDEIFEEARQDTLEIETEVYQSTQYGKIHSYKKKLLYKANRSTKKRFYKKIKFNKVTNNRNKWQCVVHVFSTIALWQGFTRVKGTLKPRCVFYDWSKIILIDAHFFKRYRERYLEVKKIPARSAIDHFNEYHSVIIRVPILLDEFELSDSMFVLKNGIGLGQKLGTDKPLIDENKEEGRSTSHRYRINTFINFDQLKKTQIQEILDALYCEVVNDEDLMKEYKSRLFSKYLLLKTKQLEEIAPILIRKKEAYSK